VTHFQNRYAVGATAFCLQAGLAAEGPHEVLHSQPGTPTLGIVDPQLCGKLLAELLGNYSASCGGAPALSLPAHSWL
jgi:hypothetical protein